MRDMFTLLGTQDAAVGPPQRSSGSHRHILTTRNQNTEQNFTGRGPIFSM